LASSPLKSGWAPINRNGWASICRNTRAPIPRNGGRLHSGIRNLRNIALIVARPAGACSGQQARQLLATVCDAGPRVENDIVDVVRVQLLRSSGHIDAAADLQGGRLHVFVLGLLARHQLSCFPGFPTMFRSISSGGMLVRSFEISATTLSDTSLCRALRRSPMIIGGATITSWAYSPRFAAV